MALTRSALAALAVALSLASCAVRAGTAGVAVAANFAAPAKRLAEQFERRTGHRLRLSAGSTGKLYAQVRGGAPFDALLAADRETPARLERERLAVAGSRFTYAIGALALWSAQPGFVDGAGVLRRGAFRHLAIANPKLAPYGAAARQAMEELGVWDALKDRVVQGENIAQTFQFVASGNAELGFVALSQLRERGSAGSAWRVPSPLHAPLYQDAVLLARGADNAAARQFLEFLHGAQARQLIVAYGYDVP
jgi:molybdate transport system substrate-binding protein